MAIYFLFFGGLILLIKGAALLIKGASALAIRLGISELSMGLTLVALGTSLPELTISVTSSIGQNPDLAIGNIVGSNIANILLILGISSIVLPLTIKRQITWTEIPFGLLAAVLFALFTNDALLNGAQENILSRSDGFVFLAFAIAFLAHIYNSARKHGRELAYTPPISTGNGAFRPIAHVIMGLGMLAFGGGMTVKNAALLAAAWGISQAFIGLVVVAIGTSLPELATSLVAAYKKKPDIAIGNIVGSNIFNIFLILGISAAITPLPFNTRMNFDLGIMILSSLLLFISMFVGKKHVLGRWNGALFVLFYVGYLAYSVYLG